MTNKIKITSFEAENVKRIQVVRMDLDKNALTVVGGNNAQGKTSILDAICWALGGGRKAPTSPKREGSMGDPTIKLTLSNGITVERTGKNATLKVTDPEGKKSGQSLLDSMISELALDLPKFMESNDKKKAETLLQIIGVGDKLKELDRKEEELSSDRLLKGREADAKKKYALELPEFDTEYDDVISPAEVIAEQQAVLTANAEKQAKVQKVTELKATLSTVEARVEAEEKALEALLQQVEQSKTRLADLKWAYEAAAGDVKAAEEFAKDLTFQSTAEFEEKLADIEEINDKIRCNMTKEQATEQAKGLKAEYDEFTAAIEAVREERTKLLDEADLPLPGLSVDAGILTYNGRAWDCMSGAEQLKVSTAIVRKLKPQCGFVLLDKLEQMDLPMLEAFARWCESEDLQVIGTRVSTGDECSIIIEDGKVASPTQKKFSEIENPFGEI